MASLGTTGKSAEVEGEGVWPVAKETTGAPTAPIAPYVGISAEGDPGDDRGTMPFRASSISAAIGDVPAVVASFGGSAGFSVG